MLQEFIDIFDMKKNPIFSSDETTFMSGLIMGLIIALTRIYLN